MVIIAKFVLGSLTVLSIHLISSLLSSTLAISFDENLCGLLGFSLTSAVHPLHVFTSKSSLGGPVVGTLNSLVDNS